MSLPDNTHPVRTLRWDGLSDRGRIRKNNEDSFLALQFDAREAHLLGKQGEASGEAMDFAFAVSDGMGGALAGEFASRITVEKITRLLPASFKLPALGLAAGVNDVMAELFTQIHRALTVLGESYEECAGMGTTLSLAWFTPRWMYFAHVGDSRIYYLPAREGGMRQITEDDSHVGWLRRTGKINEREAKSHPRRNVLQKALGAGHQFIDPQLGAVAYEAGDIFLLCTDGVTDGLFDEQILERLRNPDPAEAAQTPARRIVEASLERSGRDNTTALVIEVL